MNKPITMIIKDTQTKLANVCNESGLSPVILDLIVNGIYSEIHILAEKQAMNEEMSYMQSINHNDIYDDDSKTGDANEQ